MRKKACDAGFSAGEGQSDSEFGLGMVATFRRLVLLGFGRVGNGLVIRHVIRSKDEMGLKAA